MVFSTTVFTAWTAVSISFWMRASSSRCWAVGAAVIPPRAK